MAAPAEDLSVSGMISLRVQRLPRSSRWRGSEEAETGLGTSQVETPLKYVGAPLAANAKAAKTQKPSERALNYPSMLSWPLA
jgi:hypothetical protein